MLLIWFLSYFSALFIVKISTYWKPPEESATLLERQAGLVKGLVIWRPNCMISGKHVTFLTCSLPTCEMEAPIPHGF